MNNARNMNSGADSGIFHWEDPQHQSWKRAIHVPVI